MSACTVRPLAAATARACGSRSTPVTAWPRAANHCMCRPAPQATSSTLPPLGTRWLQRRIQSEGSWVACMVVLVIREVDLLRHPRLHGDDDDLGAGAPR